MERAILFLLFSTLSFLLMAQNNDGKVDIKSGNPQLTQAFNWAKNKALLHG